MKVVLLSLSAKQVHKCLAPWCLKAYAEKMGFIDEIKVLELTVNDLEEKVAAAIIANKPDVLGISCYIWNINMVKHVGATVKLILPDTKIVLGGPEVSFEENFEAFPFADAIISGPGESPFYEYLQKGTTVQNAILSETTHIPFSSLPSPYTEAYFSSFSQNSLRDQLIYYESTRGCPFRCSYCLSSLSGGVESLPLERVYADLNELVKRGATCIKFVDRTFNADKKRAAHILQFVQSLDTDCVFHFEAAPDLFDESLLTLLESMPEGRVQLEMGIQSVNEETLNACSRKTDVEKAIKAIERISFRNNVHTHVDLIAGLPLETLDTFKIAVNRCLKARPHALQLGFLKFLKGSALRMNADKDHMVYLDEPPYEVLKTPDMSYEQMQRLKAIENVLDKYWNSGFFTQSLLFATETLFPNAFSFFEAFATYLGDTNRPKTTLKEAYRLLLSFLLLHGGGEEAKHHIKWDILSHDDKAILPEGVDRLRDPTTEMKWMQKNARVRIERFAFDGSVHVFDISKRHPVTRAFAVLQ